MKPRPLVAKAALITLALAFGGESVVQRLAMLDGVTDTIAFCALYGTLAASLFAAATIRNGAVRWLTALILAGSGMFVDGFQHVVGDDLSYEFFVIMVQSSRDAGEAFAQHRSALAFAAMQAVALAAGIGWRPHVRRVRGDRLSIVAAPLSILALTALLFVRGGDGSRGLPSPHVGVAFTLLDLYERATVESGPRGAVALPLTRRGRDDDIVLIVDESVAPRYLDINDPRGVRSGLAAPPPGIAAYNFGVAAAATHCSIGANLTLRYGGTRANYHAMARTGPSIWSYAEKAGYQTVYIDAQRTGGVFNNMMDVAEARAIDRRIQFGGVAVRDRDRAVAGRLAALLSDERRQFIYINKVGAHFPVQDKYPDAYMRYRPVGARGLYGEVSDTGDRTGLTGDAASWRLYRNAYRNTLLWNVGGFFDAVFGSTEASDAIAIYTSDHGQTLHERGEPGQATHCTPNPTDEEGAVPLVVIDWSADGDRWRDAARRNFDRTSAFRVFPTLLALMGYDPQAVQAAYGSGLGASESDPMTFDTRFNARLGRGPAWQAIDPAALARPPADDTTTDE